MPPESDVLAKTVLLVDSNQKLAEMRARRLRRYGIFVDTASTGWRARFCMRNKSYDLVLLATHDDPEVAIALRREIREQNPKQKVAFLVGPPKYISFNYAPNLIPMPPRSSTWADRLKHCMASA